MQEIVGACPGVYDSNTKYEGKDFVSVNAPNHSEKRFVYQCKAWPYGAYCSSGVSFAPGTDSGELGWNLMGWCDATVTTTSTTSTPYVGTCEWLNGTSPVTINPWSARAISTYSAGTRVRVSNQIYKCKEWPFYLWCRSVAYEPENSQYWGDAWTKAGTCASPLATSSTAISGSLTLIVNTTTARRRELLTVGSLSDSQTANLVNAVKEAIETTVCMNLPSNQACRVNILTINSKPITRHLRGDALRSLAEESIVLEYEIIINFACSAADCSDEQEIIYDIYNTIKGEMSTAIADSSFVSTMITSPSFHTLDSLLRVSHCVNEIITVEPSTGTPTTATLGTTTTNKAITTTTDLTTTDVTTTISTTTDKLTTPGTSTDATTTDVTTTTAA
eukprot:CCRYP_020119-RA/>CCRYP_020119-RA protein AED:0.08 eAED:0.08 QI:1508/1/1/1/0.83/0.42/7/0/389